MSPVLHGNKEHVDQFLYHVEVGIPHNVARLAILMKFRIQRVSFTKHALNRIEEKHLDKPSLHDVQTGEIFEIGVDLQNRPIKLGIRVHRETYDLCFMVDCNGTIITVYGRSKDDKNQTLQKGRYLYVA